MKSTLVPQTYPHEHGMQTGSTLNWLRAAVLGANDGIVSVASIVVGVAGTGASGRFIFTAGIAGLVAGALSMAVGEYVSVSSQRDTEKALLEQEKLLLKKYPKEELDELKQLYQAKGLKRSTARAVAEELSAHDAPAAHFDAELGIDPDELTNPWHAAVASAISFTVGATIPLVAIITPPTSARVPVTFAAVLAALVVTGVLSARAGGADAMRATVRVVIGGILAMAITFGIGLALGVSGV